MYAIIAESGRQYKVQQGQELTVDFRNVPKGEQIEFQRVLAVSTEGGLQLGKPILQGAKVTAEVLGPGRGRKLVIQKLRRRKNSRRHTGYRDLHTRVRIRDIITA